jgi:hypothetical protein
MIVAVETGSWASRRGDPDGTDAAFVIDRLGRFPLSAIARMCGRSQAFVETIAGIVEPPEVPRAVVPAIPKVRTHYGRCKIWRKSLPPLARAAVQAVAERNGVTYASLVAPSWHRGTVQLCHIRQEAYFDCYEIRGDDGERRYSLPLIGTWFGGRDHTAVLHGLRSYAARLKGEKYIPKSKRPAADE